MTDFSKAYFDDSHNDLETIISRDSSHEVADEGDREDSSNEEEESAHS